MTVDTARWKRSAGPWVLAASCVLALPGASAAPVAQGQPAAAAAQDGFEPLGSLPPDEGLPAAPLVMAAYGAAWLVIVLYLWSIWRRLGRVEREMSAAAQHLDDARSTAAAAPNDIAAPGPGTGAAPVPAPRSGAGLARPKGRNSGGG